MFFWSSNIGKVSWIKSKLEMNLSSIKSSNVHFDSPDASVRVLNAQCPLILDIRKEKLEKGGFDSAQPPKGLIEKVPRNSETELKWCNRITLSFEIGWLYKCLFNILYTNKPSEIT